MALILGHPELIPLKAETQAISSYSGSHVSAPFSALKGNSGSGVMNLHTGKVIGIATTGPLDLVPSTDPSCQTPRQLYDLDFGSTTVGAQGALVLASVVPKIGLQVTPTLEVHHYGPPTTPEDFPGRSFTLTVPQDPDPAPGQVERDVTWSVSQETMGPQVLEAWDGTPTSGTISPGGPPTTVLLGPVSWVTEQQGIVTASMPFFDATYGTRTPVVHHVHVGVDGFAVTPTEVFDGEYDLGIHHGDAQTYRPANRWSVAQHLTVDATEDPNDPGAPWPSWLELGGDTIPVPLTLPAKGQGSPPTLVGSADGTNLDPGTYSGWIRFRSDDSGEPPYELTRKVYFDHCREIFEAGVPQSLTLPPLGGEDTAIVDVAPTGGTVIEDVDLIVELTIDEPAVCSGSNDGCVYSVRLASPAPGGVEVLLKDFDNLPQVVYDEDTERGAAGDLDKFDIHSSPGA
jgi:hypothetical protein